jgi:hypothetical protein
MKQTSKELSLRFTSLCSPFDLVFSALWLFIAFVSVWDGYLALLYQSQLSLMELNPVGRSLIALNQGGVQYLLIAKAIGTVTAGGSLIILYERNPIQGLVVTAPIACFQLWLLMFLSFG